MASKYESLVGRLKADGAEIVTLHFDEVGELVGGLPASAFEQKSWWANDSTSHSQSLTWLSGGWRVASTDLVAHEVRFERIPPVSTFARPGSAKVEAAALEFKRALRDGDSVFTPGTSIWTTDNSAALVRAFVDQPDISGASFDDKLAKQLTGVDAGAVQLFSELYALDLLPLSDYTGATKRKCIATPLRFGGVEIVLPESLDAALSVGVLNGGVAFKTRRFFQLSYLIQVVDGLLRLPHETLTAVLDEPKAFKSAIDAIETVNAPSQRFALMYLMFPDYYLPIAKREHRNLIRDAFIHRIGASTGDTDDDLHAIYAALMLEAGRHVDLYQPPYRGQWLVEEDDKSAPDAWSQFAHWAQRIALAVDLASKERDYKVEMADRLDGARALVEADDAEWPTRLKSALNYGNLLDRFFKTHLFDDLGRDPGAVRDALLTVWTGEPDVSSLDQLGGALNSIPGTSKYTPGNVVALGSVLLMSRDLNAYPPYRPTPVDKARALLGMTETPRTSTERYEELLRLCDELLERLPQVLDDRLDAQGLLWTVVSSAPPTEWAESDRQAFLRWRGDAAPEVEIVANAADTGEIAASAVRLGDVGESLATKLHLPVAWLQEAVDLLNDRPQLIFYGPPGTGKTYVAQHLAQHLAGLNVKLVQFHPAYSYEDFFEGYRPTPTGGFELKHGPLRRIAAEAAAHPNEPYVLIIDEINRGNIAKIFGELYFLLEYRSNGVDLLYAEEGAPPFALPQNLFIIGTMNTADRSIALLDSAIRRRFSFVPLLPDREPVSGVLASWLADEGHSPEAATLLARINELIGDEDFKIGPSYLMRQAAHEDGGLERVWRTSVLPLLEEHHFGDLTRADVERKYGLAALRAATGAVDAAADHDIEAEDEPANP